MTILEIGQQAEEDARETLANGDPEAEIEHAMHQSGGSKEGAAIYLRTYHQLYLLLLLKRLNGETDEV